MLAMVTLFVSACATKSDINDLHNQINELKVGKVATIEQQVSGVQSSIASLQSLVNTLQQETTSIKSDLSSKEKALSDRIDALKKYVDDELSKANNWASATFATLEQYQAVLNELALIKQSLTNLDMEVASKIEKAISASESTMKGWVSEQLAGYYTIAQIDAKLKALAEADASTQSSISKLTSDLATAKSDLTEAYTKAIEEAINKHNGNISAKIAADIKAATDLLNARIDALDERVTALEGTVMDLLNRVQSVNVLPQYSDGGVAVYSVGCSEIEFEIYPLDVAQKLAETPDAFSMKCLETIKTKSSSETPILSVSYSDGIVTVGVSATALDESFFNASSTCSARLLLSNGNVSIASSYFNLHGIKGGVMDLSSSGTSNCYLVSSEGMYSFDLVKGNTHESLENVASVEVVWESFGTEEKPQSGDLIKDIKIKKNKVTFTASNKKGNALIAAKNNEGVTIWSWHIWMTDTPSDQTYRNDAGILQDRNLGATSREAGDPCSLGLFYQWGRKDPFLGAGAIKGSSFATSTYSWPSPIMSTSENGTIAYTIANPTTFIYATLNSDWLFGGANDGRWSADKTIYDPCPVGYRVPDMVWSVAKLGSSDFTYDSVNRGIKGNNMLVSGSFWYPAAGKYKGWQSGELTWVGSTGVYLSCVPDNYFPAVHARSFSYQLGEYIELDKTYHCEGGSVRCMKE